MTEHFRKHWQADPLLIIGGEVHNSNSSSAEAMAPVWKKADELCLNTVLAPVTWEMLEPQELTLNQWVLGSSPRWCTKKALRKRKAFS